MQGLRRKLSIVCLVLYWPTLFVLAHIQIPQVVRQANVSDKGLHYLAYFLLVFLLWGAVKPYEKVDWRKAAVWWIILVIVWYGVMDEWLQGFVGGRTPDVKDFMADLVGAVTSLVLLSIVPFWPAILWAAGASIFVLTSCTRADLTRLVPVTNTAFHFLAYAVFAGLWLLYQSRPGSANGPWSSFRTAYRRVLALAVPLGLLAAVKLGAMGFGKRFTGAEMLVSICGIAAAGSVGWLIRRWAPRSSRCSSGR